MKLVYGKDYYDGAHMGIDPGIVFVRNGEHKAEEFENFNFGSAPNTGVILHGNSFVTFTPMVVYFAGKVYPGVVHSVLKNKYDPNVHTNSYRYPKPPKDLTSSPHEKQTPPYWLTFSEDPWKHDYIYDKNEVLKLLKKYKIENNRQYWIDSKTYKQSTIEFFDANYGNRKAMLIKAMVVVGWEFPGDEEHNQCSINDYTLEQVRFYQVVDAFTAFQEISNYVGGVLPNKAAEMVELSDKDRVRKAGFDSHSFRTPKGGGKKRKQRKWKKN